MAEGFEWSKWAGYAGTLAGSWFAATRWRRARSIDISERLERVERKQAEIHRVLEELKTQMQDNDSRVDAVERKQDNAERMFRRIERLLADIWSELTNFRGQMPPSLPPRPDAPPSR